MEFKQLEAFIAVLEQKSFSKAAELLYLSQPAISNQVASLERELDVQLFIRSAKEVLPTKEGRIFYRCACEIIDKRSSAVQALQNIHSMVNGTVAIGAYSIAIHHYLPQLIAEFQKRHRHVSFRIYNYDSLRILQNIVDGKIELGITGIYVASQQCESRELVTDRWVVITPNNARYRSMQSKKFPPSQLTQERFICREPGSGTHKDLDHFLAPLGIRLGDLKTIAEVDDTESIIQMVACGIGISIVSQRAAEPYTRFGQVLTFDLDSMTPSRPIYLVRNQNLALSTAAQRFYDFALKYYQPGTPSEPDQPDI